MNDILDDFSAANLAKALEGNLISWMGNFKKVWQVKEDDPPGLKRSISPVPLALFNSIMDANLASDNVDMAIQSVKADAEARKVPVLWWIGPSTRPADLATHLERHGFSLDDETPGMAVNLSKINEALPGPEGLAISEVVGAVAIQEWCNTMAEGFEVPASMLSLVVESWNSFMGQIDSAITKAYIARLNSQPVATSMLHLGHGVVGIYSVATIPEARRKGIGAVMTQFPLLHGRTLGYKVGVLGASQMGFSVYRALGFQEYCRIKSYVYHPKL
jgi:GNAT superfamily N-acetyltransferase